MDQHVNTLLSKNATLAAAGRVDISEVTWNEEYYLMCAVNLAQLKLGRPD